MKKFNHAPGPKDRKAGQPGQQTGREESLADSSPTDNRSDEKVIVNEQRENKIVNAPSQTAANTGEGNSNDDDIMD